jgi:hypothetical protein
MKIIKRPDGTRNFISDQNTANFLNYSGRIGIEIRVLLLNFYQKTIRLNHQRG